MAAHSLFQQARKLKTANWGKKVCSQKFVFLSLHSTRSNEAGQGKEAVFIQQKAQGNNSIISKDTTMSKERKTACNHLSTHITVLVKTFINKLGLSWAKLSCQLGFGCTVIYICCHILIYLD